MKLQDCFIGQNVGVNSKSKGVIVGTVSSMFETKDKEGNFTGNYRTLGYYSTPEAVIKKIQSEVLLSTISEVNTLESLLTMLESYMSKLHDNVRDVVKELRK